MGVDVMNSEDDDSRAWIYSGRGGAWYEHMGLGRPTVSYFRALAWRLLVFVARR